MKRFWDKVAVNHSGCWEWTASLDRNGYGKFCHKGKREISTRFAWKITNGEIPPGMYVCHRCDNPLCVNPAHLFLGTPSDNSSDMVKKGRHRPHVGTINRKFDSVMVSRVLTMKKAGMSARLIARCLPISRGQIKNITAKRQHKEALPHENLYMYSIDGLLAAVKKVRET